MSRWAGALLVGALVETLMPGTAAAATGRTVYVDHKGTASAPAKGKCGEPNFSTIQAAVNDVSATRIVVCKGRYTEQLTVARGVTLEGQSGAVIQAPAVVSGAGAVLTFSGAQQSRLKGFTISGASTADPNLGAGVFVVAGAEVSISGNHIRDIRGDFFGSAQGHGIIVQQARADISDNTIERYGSEGTGVSSSSTFAMIDGNIIRGQQGQGINNGQVGIDIRESGAGDVEDNTVTGNGVAGIVVDETGNVSVRDNAVSHNGKGIVLAETGSVVVRSNVVRNNTSDGVFLDDASGNIVAENEFADNAGDGVRVDVGEPNALKNLIATNKVHDNAGNGIDIALGATTNTVKQNKIHHNGGTDIVDANGAPPVNTYSHNSCATSNPSGLCAS